MNSTEVQNPQHKLNDHKFLCLSYVLGCLCKAFLLALRTLSLITLPQTLAKAFLRFIANLSEPLVKTVKKV